MKKLKIFPKMFIQIFSVLSIIVLLIHISIYLIFPKTYLDTREAEINKTANEISYSLEGKNINDIKRATELYSKNSDILVNNKIGSEHIYIGRNAFNVILSNLISNAVKYTNNCGIIDIGMDEDCFYIKNSYIESQIELNKDTSHGLGLYIVNNLLNNYQIDYEFLFLLKV